MPLIISEAQRKEWESACVETSSSFRLAEDCCRMGYIMNDAQCSAIKKVTNPRMCLHCCTSTRSEGLALPRVTCNKKDCHENEAYTVCNERKSCCSWCKEDSMSLLFTAASELRVRNDDCAESGSFFIMARSLIEAENCAIEPPSDIWIWMILRWRQHQWYETLCFYSVITIVAGVVAHKRCLHHAVQPSFPQSTVRVQNAMATQQTTHR